MSDDFDLWDRIVKGDETAFALVFRQHANHLFKYFHYREASWHVAEELMADVFLEVWRRRKELALHQDGIRPLLFVIARGRIQNHRRSRKRRSKAQWMILPVDEADPADDVACRADAKRDGAKLREAMSCLTDAELAAVGACIFLELPCRTAATELGVSEAAVRSSLHRAKEKLRRLGVEFDSEET